MKHILDYVDNKREDTITWKINNINERTKTLKHAAQV